MSLTIATLGLSGSFQSRLAKGLCSGTEVPVMILSQHCVGLSAASNGWSLPPIRTILKANRQGYLSRDWDILLGQRADASETLNRLGPPSPTTASWVRMMSTGVGSNDGKAVRRFAYEPAQPVEVGDLHAAYSSEEREIGDLDADAAPKPAIFRGKPSGPFDVRLPAPIDVEMMDASRDFSPVNARTTTYRPPAKHFIPSRDIKRVDKWDWRSPSGVARVYRCRFPEHFERPTVHMIEGEGSTYGEVARALFANEENQHLASRHVELRYQAFKQYRDGLHEQAADGTISQTERNDAQRQLEQLRVPISPRLTPSKNQLPVRSLPSRTKKEFTTRSGFITKTKPRIKVAEGTTRVILSAFVPGSQKVTQITGDEYILGTFPHPRDVLVQTGFGPDFS